MWGKGPVLTAHAGRNKSLHYTHNIHSNGVNKNHANDMII